MSKRLLLALIIPALLIAAAGFYDAYQHPKQPKPIPVPVAVTPANPPPQPALPSLPEVTIKESPIHAVPEDTVLPGDRKSDGTIRDHNVSDEVANGPKPLASIPAPPKQFSGSVAVTGAVTLQLGPTRVSFGVKPALPTDRCGMERRTCAEQARDTLTADIGAAGSISCHTPLPNPTGGVANAICLNSQGIDLGGVLVSSGLALADTSQSYDYVGAESLARGQKRGLWQNR